MRLGSLGPVELLLIVVAIMLIFGASKLGDIGGALGKSIREFKKEANVPEAKSETTTTVVEPQDAAKPTVTTVTEKPAAVGAGDYRPPDATTSS